MANVTYRGGGEVLSAHGVPALLVVPDEAGTHRLYFDKADRANEMVKMFAMVYDFIHSAPGLKEAVETMLVAWELEPANAGRGELRIPGLPDARPLSTRGLYTASPFLLERMGYGGPPPPQGLLPPDVKPNKRPPR